MTKMIRYYHATPYSNLTSIMMKGIEARFGEVYCSTVQDTAAIWISFTRASQEGADRIAVLPFERPEGDPRMSPGMDHSPILCRMFGFPEESASFVSSETIPNRDIMWNDVLVYDNPFLTNEEMKEDARGEEE